MNKPSRKLLPEFIRTVTYINNTSASYILTDNSYYIIFNTNQSTTLTINASVTFYTGDFIYVENISNFQLLFDATIIQPKESFILSYNGTVWGLTKIKDNDVIPFKTSNNTMLKRLWLNSHSATETPLVIFANANNNSQINPLVVYECKVAFNNDIMLIRDDTIPSVHSLRYMGSTKRLEYYNHNVTPNLIMSLPYNTSDPVKFGPTVKISTNDESAPDVVNGGLCLNTATTGRSMTIKRSGSTHSFSSVVENDTFFWIKHDVTNANGMEIGAISNQTTGEVAALKFIGYGRVPAVTSALTSVGIIDFDTYKLSGTSGIAPTVNDNIFSIRAGGVTMFHIRASGNVRLNTTQTQNAFDDYDDITLVQAAKNKLAGWDSKILKKHDELLNKLGIIEDGFMDIGKMHALELGVIDQLWNVIRELGNKLGLTNDELITLSKKYQ